MTAVQKDSGDKHIQSDDDKLIMNDQRTSRIKSFFSNITIEPLVFLFYGGSISYMVTFPQYVYSAIGKQHGLIINSSTNEACNSETTNQMAIENIVQSESSSFNLINSVVCMAPSFLVTMLMGRYCSLKGRRLAIILPLVGSALRSFLAFLVVYFQWSVYVLVAAGLVESCCGGSTLLTMATIAYISDVSSESTRSMRILILQVAMGLGITSTNLATGYIIRQAGFDAAFLFSFAAMASATVYTIVFVKETITSSSDVNFFSVTHIVDIFRVYSRDDGNNRRWKLLIMLTIIILASTVDIGSEGVTNLFLLRHPLCFTPVLLGYFKSISGVFRWIWAIVTMNVLHSVLQDTGVVLWGGVAGVAVELLMAFSYNITMVSAAAVVKANTLLIIPLCSSFSSKLVQQQELGSMFAAVSVAEQMGVFVGSMFFNMVYSKTSAHFVGSAYLVGAGFYLVLLLLAIALHLRVRKEEKADLSVAPYIPLDD